MGSDPKPMCPFRRALKPEARMAMGRASRSIPDLPGGNLGVQKEAGASGLGIPGADKGQAATAEEVEPIIAAWRTPISAATPVHRRCGGAWRAAATTRSMANKMANNRLAGSYVRVVERSAGGSRMSPFGFGLAPLQKGPKKAATQRYVRFDSEPRLQPQMLGQ